MLSFSFWCLFLVVFDTLLPGQWLIALTWDADAALSGLLLRYHTVWCLILGSQGHWVKSMGLCSSDGPAAAGVWFGYFMSYKWSGKIFFTANIWRKPSVLFFSCVTLLNVLCHKFCIFLYLFHVLRIQLIVLEQCGDVFSQMYREIHIKWIERHFEMQASKSNCHAWYQPEMCCTISRSMNKRHPCNPVKDEQFITVISPDVFLTREK